MFFAHFVIFSFLVLCGFRDFVNFARCGTLLYCPHASRDPTLRFRFILNSTGVTHTLWLFVWGKKRSPHKTYGGPYPRSRLQSMFVLLLLSTKFWYVGPLKETKAKVTFLLILHPLRPTKKIGVKTRKNPIYRYIVVYMGTPVLYISVVDLASSGI